jgi:hypothetical protein
MNLFNKTFKTTLLFLALIELLSFLGYYSPIVNKIGFFVILIIALVLALTKLEYGVYLLLAELFVGSKGYLFYFDYGGAIISLRIGLFLVIMGVWLYNQLKNKSLSTKSVPSYYWPIFLAIAWGMLYGFLRGNSFNNIFFDANAWIYFLVIFPLYASIKTSEQIGNVLQIFLASLVDIIFKSLFVLWIFSHEIIGFSADLYRWIRTSGVGEITPVAGNFYRVFFQSQIYALLGFFILLCLWYWQRRTVISNPSLLSRTGSAERSEKSNSMLVVLDSSASPWATLGMTVLMAFSLLTVIISFSRSFWVALAGGLVLFFVYFIFVTKESWLKLLKVAGILLAIAIIDLVFLYVFISWPRPSGVSLASLLGDRISSSEAAGVSRMNQLEPLTRSIIKHPLIGSGFGMTVTYKTLDPRILRETPSGIYTTYAFEWGYLDILLKIGLVGLLMYLWLIWNIAKRLILDPSASSGQVLRFKISDSGLYVGFLLGLVALLLVNIFTPYLNHPLGIGFILLASVVLTINDNKLKI